MNAQTFRLRWGRQFDIPLTLYQAVQRIKRVFNDLLSVVVIPKDSETWVDRVGHAEPILFPIRMVPLPLGYRDRACPECGGGHLTGALLSPDADESDPNVFCRTCSWVG
jgi:hypothetical protein